MSGNSGIANVLVDAARQASAPVDQGGGLGAFQTAFDNARAQARKDAEERLGKQLVNGLNAMETRKGVLRADVRRVDAERTKLVKALDSIDLAQKYGAETGNFVPFFLCVGLVSRMDFGEADAELCNVPKDWAPKTAAK